MIQNWHEYLAKLTFKKRNTAVLFNCCKKAAARIRWTRRASTTWACLIWSLSKSPKPHRTWKARWQLGSRSRLLRTPGGCSLKQKLNDKDDHGLPSAAPPQPNLPTEGNEAKEGLYSDGTQVQTSLSSRCFCKPFFDASTL